MGMSFCKLSKPLEAKNLKISFQGQAMTNVRVYHRYGYTDVKGTDVYADEEKIVWEKDAEGKDDVSDTFALLSTSDTPFKSKILPSRGP